MEFGFGRAELPWLYLPWIKPGDDFVKCVFASAAWSIEGALPKPPEKAF